MFTDEQLIEVLQLAHQQVGIKHAHAWRLRRAREILVGAAPSLVSTDADQYRRTEATKRILAEEGADRTAEARTWTASEIEALTIGGTLPNYPGLLGISVAKAHVINAALSAFRASLKREQAIREFVESEIRTAAIMGGPKEPYWKGWLQMAYHVKDRLADPPAVAAVPTIDSRECKPWRGQGTCLKGTFGCELDHAVAAVPSEPPCATGHVWTNGGTDHPNGRDRVCDCGQVARH